MAGLIIDGNRIQFDIRKDDDGYDAVAGMIATIDPDKYQSWYGDIRRPDGTETSGLVVVATQETE